MESLKALSQHAYSLMVEGVPPKDVHERLIKDLNKIKDDPSLMIQTITDVLSAKLNVSPQHRRSLHLLNYIDELYVQKMIDEKDSWHTTDESLHFIRGDLRYLSDECKDIYKRIGKEIPKYED